MPEERINNDLEPENPNPAMANQSEPEMQPVQPTKNETADQITQSGQVDEAQSASVTAESPRDEKEILSTEAVEKPPQKPAKRGVVRFHIPDRVEHWTFFISFSVLAITGLIQKFSTSPISKSIILGIGGIERVRIIHRTSATIMMVVVIYHIGEIIYKLYVNRSRPNMLPSMLDLRAAWQTIRYNLMFSNRAPQQGRYSFEEKMEYWAVAWGTVIMVITGFMMWNPIATTNFLPGEVIPAAKLAHGMEAILAVLAIIIWHFYHVLIKT